MDNLAQVLKESWTLVEEDRAKIAGHFYARLFLSNPQLRELFPVQMDGQRDRLLEAIITSMQTLDDPERFADFLRGLGRDHRKYHVTPEHYALVGEALQVALRTAGGEQWTIEYDQAWRDAYALIAEKMIAGAADDAANPPFWHAEVLTHERRGRDVAVFTCRPLQFPLHYRAGQYVSIEVPATSRDCGVRTRSRTRRPRTTCWSSTYGRSAPVGSPAAWSARSRRVTCSGWRPRWVRWSWTASRTGTSSASPGVSASPRSRHWSRS